MDRRQKHKNPRRPELPGHITVELGQQSHRGGLAIDLTEHGNHVARIIVQHAGEDFEAHALRQRWVNVDVIPAEGAVEKKGFIFQGRDGQLLDGEREGHRRSAHGGIGLVALEWVREEPA